MLPPALTGCRYHSLAELAPKKPGTLLSINRRKTANLDQLPAPPFSVTFRPILLASVINGYGKGVRGRYRRHAAQAPGFERKEQMNCSTVAAG